MKKIGVVLVMLMLVIGIVGCKKKEPISGPLSVGLKVYKGQFVSYSYPSSATLRVISAKESVLVGPAIGVEASPTSDPVEDAQYAYQIHIQVYDNPLRLTADVWAKDRIINEWKRIKDGTTIYPVTPGGEIITENARFVQVGKEKAFMVDLFGFDRAIKNIYLAKDDVIIEISFPLYPVETEPLAVIQRDVYAMILGTLTLVDKK